MKSLRREQRTGGVTLIRADLHTGDAARRDLTPEQRRDPRIIREPVGARIERGGGFVPGNLDREGGITRDIWRVAQNQVELLAGTVPVAGQDRGAAGRNPGCIGRRNVERGRRRIDADPGRSRPRRSPRSRYSCQPTPARKSAPATPGQRQSGRGGASCDCRKDRLVLPKRT